MFIQFVLGSLLMLASTAIHGACTIGALWLLRTFHADRFRGSSGLVKVSLVSAFVLIMFFAALLEITIWGVTYLAVGAVPALEPALYFSAVTFTTLGYGDIVLNDDWRLLASFEAINGIIMFGWTTALVVAFVHRISGRDVPAPGSGRN